MHERPVPADERLKHSVQELHGWNISERNGIKLVLHLHGWHIPEYNGISIVHSLCRWHVSERVDGCQPVQGLSTRQVSAIGPGDQLPCMPFGKVPTQSAFTRLRKLRIR